MDKRRMGIHVPAIWLPIASLQLFIALYSQSAPRASAQGAPNCILHIDCGSTSTTVADSNSPTMLTWLYDDPYITTGVNANIAADVANFPEFNTLRYFPDTRAKNCYSLPVIPNTGYLIRATFFYGSYDNAATLPTFQMAIDETIVANITFESANLGTYREISYVTQQTNVTFLCLLRDSSQSTPFVSAISLCDLPSYGNTFHSDLYVSRDYYYTQARESFRATAGALIRSPDDPFDRYWFSQGTNSPYLQATAPLQGLTAGNESVNGSSGLYGQPAQLVMETAVTTSGNLTISLPGTQTNYKARLALYFAELSLPPNSRAFNVFIATPYTLAGVQDPAGYSSLEAYEEWIYVEPNDQNATVVLVPVNSSNTSPTSGPLLNALEFLQKIENTCTRTSDTDAAAIKEIKSSMNLTEWTGDPCLPYPHAWITCSIVNFSASPSILAVNLSGYSLSGIISPSFGHLLSLTSLALDNNELTGSLPTSLNALTNLKTLQLQNNLLTGPLPDWLASLTDLSELSVQNNNFTGAIPGGLISKNNSLNFQYKPGNPGLLLNGAPASPPQPSTKMSNIGVIVGSITGGIVALVVIVFLFICCIRRAHNHKDTNFDIEGYNIGVMGSALKLYSSDEVVVATQNFKTEIGRGGFGRVYYGKLDGQEVAIKVLDIKSSQGQGEFSNEVEILSKVRHRNLVALVGYCNEGNKQMLIYEYIHNGSLHDHLHGKSKTMSGERLNWKTRLQIALNASLGLDYLHAGCHPSIIHRDIKSSNILLPSNMELAKVADFGLSKLTYGENVSHVDTKVKGTIGYLDPEYYLTGQLSKKSDVFSFGVVLLEMITGRTPIDPTIPHCNHSNTCKWVEANIQEGKIDEILDPTIKASNPNLETIWKVLELAMQCMQTEGIQRPAMNEVTQELRNAIAMENTTSLHYRGFFNGMKAKTTMNFSHASSIESQDANLVDSTLSLGTSHLHPV